jgi:hypothetical protein
MSEFTGRWMRGGRTPLSSTPANDIARREAATTEGSVPRLNRSSPLSLLSGNCCFTALSPAVTFRRQQVSLSQKQVTLFQRVLRLCEAGCSYPPVRVATAGPPPSGAPLSHAGGPMAPGTNQVPWASSPNTSWPCPVFGAAGERAARPRPLPSTSHPQMLRLCPAGHCYPPRLDRIDRDLPHGSALAANRNLHGSLSASRNPWVPWLRRRDDPQAIPGRRA